MTIQKAIKKLRIHWAGNNPIEGFDSIDAIEAHIGRPLPADYKYFHQWFSNGGETLPPFNYCYLIEIDKVLEHQKLYDIDGWAPGYLIFASEGDDVFCFNLSTKKSSADYRVVRLSVSCRDIEEAEEEANNFEDFVTNLISTI